MRNQAFFSSHRLFHFFSPFFLCGTGMSIHTHTHTNRQTDRQACTQGLKNIRSTQPGAIKECAVSFLLPLLFHNVVSSCAPRGSTGTVPVFGMPASLMEYTNLTTDTASFFTSLGTLCFVFFFFSLFFFSTTSPPPPSLQLAPRLFRSLPSSLKISQVACGERHTLFALEDGSVAACG